METEEQSQFLSNMSDHYLIFHMEFLKTPKLWKQQRIKRLVNEKTTSNFIGAIKKKGGEPFFNHEMHRKHISYFQISLRNNVICVFQKSKLLKRIEIDYHGWLMACVPL